MKKKVYTMLAFIVIIIGIFLCNIGTIEKHSISNLSEHQLKKTIIPIYKNKSANKNADYDFNKVSNKSNPINLFQAAISKDDNNIIGKISIPNIKLNLGIFEGLDNNSLLKGAGTMKPEFMGVGNYVLAGHNVNDSSLLFAPLKKTRNGDEIILQDNNSLYTYVTYQKKVVYKNDVSWVDDTPNDKIITLITCDSPKANEPYRLIVRGKLLNKEAVTFNK